MSFALKAWTFFPCPGSGCHVTILSQTQNFSPVYVAANCRESFPALNSMIG